MIENDELVVVPMSKLVQTIQDTVNGTMEKWLDKKIQQEREDKANEETMLTINEVISKYKLSRSTVYRRTKDGTIPCSQLGARKLINKSDIERVIKDGKLS